MFKHQQKIKLALLALIVINMFFGQLNFAYAQEVYDYRQGGAEESIRTYLCTPGGANSEGEDLFQCINKIYKFVLILASVIGVFFIVIAGYVYMSAEGNQESVDKAKNILLTTVASLVILFGGFVLLKALNPDLVEYKYIQPESVAPAPATGGPAITKTGIAGCGITADGSSCADYTDSGLSGNSTQQSGQNTFLSKGLINTLVQVKSSFPNFRINEAYPPTVYHYSGCHTNKTCVDIGATNRTASQINNLCKALKSAGLRVLNEYPSFVQGGVNQIPECGTFESTGQSTGGHLHVQ